LASHEGQLSVVLGVISQRTTEKTQRDTEASREATIHQPV